ncbi:MULTISPECIES: RsfA family transcriptional regulator [Thermoactinomyces]|jgi:prespore-specific regulator|uniref:RsfA family transcriptional regulator n=1 Tax=Thermoactinomyces vulgaris TaxID=2026 RepID=A0ABS0QJE3_THEVU|nr:MULTISPECIES: RsfA family transcriptional regulator [Thermoactinomyces]KFZ40664.1 precorrin-3B C17-methyltransferase [Thermoactinomyces sp. Gus2-1]KYQ86938.1 precorrin-3B C(17)-methyltransferase [Thermoactinomyces sp. AS95]MBA4551694.1 RsfA family transcriptional regulator [Thermoactinomyces vulgaris]MBA4596427.1 RsfA family transcriptional regulator [Thermoactinomyces vulgaris]MBH8582842.1 RsfA family transcriptional regulator [Thermoactinomyces sp. CICC 10735]
MAVKRQDAWTPDDDMILAEVTLRHIREGGTQLSAFEEVAEKLGRTPAACGFRWNSTVRKKYESAIQIAKQQRQKKLQERGKTGYRFRPDSLSSENMVQSIDKIIRFLRQYKTEVSELQRQQQQLEKELKERENQIRKLEKENQEMKEQLNDVKSDYRLVNDDYRTLVQIMERARKLAIQGDGELQDKSRFKPGEESLEQIDK